MEWIACHRENDASVLHHVQRAIVSLPEKREVYGVKWRKSEIPHYAIPNFGTFFGLKQEERCELEIMEIRRSMNSEELNVTKGGS